MKIEITKFMNIYRECARHLWNTYFLEQLKQLPPQNQWDVSDEFDDICTMLFASLVQNQIGYTSHKKSHRYEQYPEPLFCLHIVPSVETGVPIDINREVKSCGYWDYPMNRVKPSDVDLRFIDFFDFDVLGYKDFEYYRVRIMGAPDYPEMIGRDALLKTSDVNVFFVDDAG